MDAARTLHDLTERGLKLDIEGDRLTVTPASKLTDDDRAAIRRLKPDLLELLRRPIWRWRVIEADGREIECTVTPWHTLAEMREAHPDALVIAPLGNRMDPIEDAA